MLWRQAFIHPTQLDGGVILDSVTHGITANLEVTNEHCFTRTKNRKKEQKIAKQQNPNTTNTTARVAPQYLRDNKTVETPYQEQITTNNNQKTDPGYRLRRYTQTIPKWNKYHSYSCATISHGYQNSCTNISHGYQNSCTTI